MTRLRILVVVATAASLLAIPVTAAESRPKAKTQTYEVTMTGDLATTCTGPITMSGTFPGQLRADEQVVATNVAVPWNRSYDADWGVSAPALSGCHGPSASALETGRFPGALILDFGRFGDTVTLTWRLDYYWQFGVNPRNGRPSQEVLEFLELNSGEIPLTALPDGGLVALDASVDLALFTKEGKTITNVFVPLGTDTLDFTITIEPTG